MNKSCYSCRSSISAITGLAMPFAFFGWFNCIAGSGISQAGHSSKGFRICIVESAISNQYHIIDQGLLCNYCNRTADPELHWWEYGKLSWTYLISWIFLLLQPYWNCARIVRNPGKWSCAISKLPRHLKSAFARPILLHFWSTDLLCIYLHNSIQISEHWQHLDASPHSWTHILFLV